MFYFYIPGSHQKTFAFLMNSVVIEVNQFTQIRLLSEAKLGDDPYKLDLMVGAKYIIKFP